MSENLASAVAQRVSAATAALGQMTALGTALQSAATVLSMLEGAVQVAAELDVAISKKRAELAASTEKAINAARAEGVRQRDKIIDDARSLAGEMQNAAAQKLRDANATVEAKAAEHAEIEGKIAALKSHAKSLAG